MACERVEHVENSRVVTLPAVKHEAGESGARSHRRSKSMKELVSMTRRRSPIKQSTRNPALLPNSLSPGQQMQAQHISQLMSLPSHPLTQQILSSHYSLPQSVTGEGRKEGRHQGQLATGPTTTHLTTLPCANRRDAQVHINYDNVLLGRASADSIYIAGPHPQAIMNNIIIFISVDSAHHQSG